MMEIYESGYTKERAFVDAQDVCNTFLRENNLELPTYKNAVLDHTTRPELAVFQHTGLYYNGTVIVNFPVVAMPRWRPSPRSQSWPGWKTDRTMHGVIAHEVGHHVYEQLQRAAKGHGNVSAKEWFTVLKRFGNPPRVSSYEPVPTESFAESMRLFILNPALLRMICPYRFDLLMEFYKLKPTELRDTDEVLVNAPDMIIEKLHDLEDKCTE